MASPLDSPAPDGADAAASVGLLRRISRLELVAAGLVAAVLAVLVAVEPDIVRAPFASSRAVAFTFGGTALAAAAFVAMLARRVPPVARLVVVGLPFLAVNVWLLSPYFVDEAVDDTFAVTIAEAASGTTALEAAGVSAPARSAGAVAPNTAGSAGVSTPAPTSASTPASTPASAAPANPATPVLVGAGRFEGLAGHDGTGDAAIFRLPDGGHVLRFENFDIDNGPALRLYLVPGADRRSIEPGAVDLGKLRGNVGDQTYDLPAGLDFGGPWTALVWCEAFSVEFVGATIAR